MTIIIKFIYYLQIILIEIKTHFVFNNLKSQEEKEKLQSKSLSIQYDRYRLHNKHFFIILIYSK